MNETLTLIAERYSCRSYTDQMPTDEQLQALALAAVQAPSARNMQPWRVIVVKNKELLDDLETECMKLLSEMEDQTMYELFMERGGKVFYDVPAAIVIPIQPGGELDCGIVTQNIVLAAQSMGIANVICGMMSIPLSGPRGSEFKQRLGFEAGFEFGMAVLLGFAAEGKDPHEPDLTKISYVN